MQYSSTTRLGFPNRFLTEGGIERFQPGLSKGVTAEHVSMVILTTIVKFRVSFLQVRSMCSAGGVIIRIFRYTLSLVSFGDFRREITQEQGRDNPLQSRQSKDGMEPSPVLEENDTTGLG